MKKIILIFMTACLFLTIGSRMEAQIPDDLLPMPKEVALDSLLMYHSVVIGDTTVPAGVIACLDTTGAIAVAAYDDTLLNLKTLGVGTGTAGEMVLAGKVAVNGVTKIGRMYYLVAGGTVSDIYPTAGNVWIVPLGRCAKEGYLDFKPSEPFSRMP